MRLDQEQLDWIVGEVVRRLHALSQRGDATPGGYRRVASAPPENSCKEVALCDRVVTVRSLEGRLDGVGVVHVDARSIVTPAVRDLLAEHCIQLVRGDAAAVQLPDFVGQRSAAAQQNCDQCCRY